LKGCRITRNAPPAKFDNSPDHGHADSYAGGCQQGREAGGLDSEEAQDGDDQHDIQQRRHGRVDVADESGINLLLGQRAPDQAKG